VTFEEITGKNMGVELTALASQLHSYLHNNKGKEIPGIEKGEKSWSVSRKTSWGLQIFARTGSTGETDEKNTWVTISLNPNELHKWLRESGISGRSMCLDFKGIYMMWKRGTDRKGSLAIFSDPDRISTETIIYACQGDSPASALEGYKKIRLPDTEEKMFVPSKTLAEIVVGETGKALRVK